MKYDYLKKAISYHLMLARLFDEKGNIPSYEGQLKYIAKYAVLLQRMKNERH